MKLNVLLVCYNASRFIKECLESILMQKTDFDFNIIVADDKSTDDTLTKIQSMAINSDKQFVYLESEENLGIVQNYTRAFEACNAEYIAVMEGDDIWCDPNRLQKHVDFLDNHRECVMTQNGMIYANYEDVLFTILSPLDYRIYKDCSGVEYFLASARDIISKMSFPIGSNFSRTIYRRSVMSRLPRDFYMNCREERYLAILMCQYGYLGFLTENMNIYRIHYDSLYQTSLRGCLPSLQNANKVVLCNPMTGGY